ncbi:MAG: aldo/keto reductase, partial [Oscillospiraceae bacterium]|nr:aldo/keto reductase [Oscillospiraceae bacterium]
MRYNEFNGEKLSALGFGCMRLPVLDNDQSKIDMPKVEEMLMYAYEHGINYYDTAYPYHNGFSEVALGEILARNGIRDKVNIATKLFTLEIGRPGFDPEKMLATQLERLQTDHIDYYLIHGLHGDQWDRLKNEYNIVDFLAEKRRTGVIRHMGFSFHDSYEAFVKIIDDYDWEFAQIQYNYLDNEIQAGDRGLRYAQSKGIPLNIMEPIKGGNLIFPDYPAIEKIRAKHGITESNAELALRYVFDKENLHVVLSGMSALDQVKENIAIADRCHVGCLTENEKACIDDIRAFL